MTRRTAGVLLACVALVALSGCGAGGRESPAAGQRVVAVVLDARGHALAAVRADAAFDSAVADGRGGWYVSGSFRHIGGVARRRLARIDRFGAVDTRWRPRLGRARDSDAYAQLAYGHGRVYLSGSFGRVDGRRRSGAAAVDARTGALERWNPGGPVGGVVAVAPGRVLLSGEFDEFDVYAADPVSGRRLRAFHLHVTPVGDVDGIDTIAVAGRRVYVGGGFKRVNGVARVGVARVALRTGHVVRRWRPARIAESGACECLLVDALAARGRQLFVSGFFGSAGRVRAPNGLVALDARTGRVTRFRAAHPGRYGGRERGTYTVVSALGKRLFAGGLFGDRHAHGFTTLDRRTGRHLPSWHPPGRRAHVTAVTASGPRVLVVGAGLAP